MTLFTQSKPLRESPPSRPHARTEGNYSQGLLHPLCYYNVGPQFNKPGYYDSNLQPLVLQTSAQLTELAKMQWTKCFTVYTEWNENLTMLQITWCWLSCHIGLHVAALSNNELSHLSSLGDCFWRPCTIIDIKSAKKRSLLNTFQREASPGHKTRVAFVLNSKPINSFSLSRLFGFSS